VLFLRIVDKKYIALGLVIFVALAGVVILLKRPQTPKPVPTPTPNITEKIESGFNYQIPEDVERIELKDVSGGTGSGLATRKFENGKFSHVILADLEDPAAGSFYEGWLVRGKQGDSNYSIVLTGKLRVAKGGYLLEFESDKDYSDYKQVIVTLEKVDDKNPETHILEGSF
jgi:hypothetical protein